MQQGSRSTNDFNQAFHALIPRVRLGSIMRHHGAAKRRPAQVSASNIVSALVFHIFRGVGTLSENLQILHNECLSDSSMSGRRASLPWKAFELIMSAALGPKAQPGKHHGAFHKGFRLVAIDGSEFSVQNTPQINSMLAKAKTRHLKAAFAKVGVALLVELGVHNPLAAEIGQSKESEMVLSKKLLDRLPAGCLLLADRYYGVNAFLGVLVERFKKVSGAFLLRVRSNLKPQWIKTLHDGSALVCVALEKGKSTIVREIRGRVRRDDGEWVDVRFWTNLLDYRKHPAKELLGLYARRWDQELMYKQIKVDMRDCGPLKSHTVHTAAQEVAALILAHAVIAQTRMETAGRAGCEVLSMSFVKTLDLVRSLWVVLAAGQGIISEQQASLMTQRMMSLLADWMLPKRRKRACPRKVRQPIKGWPRLSKTSYEVGEFEYEVVKSYA